MNQTIGTDPHAPTTVETESRQALRAGIERAKARLQGLPAAEQKRLYEQSRAQSPTLFALLHRLREDPATDQLVRAAVERTRCAPTAAELARAIARTFTSVFRAGHLAFRPAAHVVLCRLCEEFGDDNARRIKLCDLQRAYFAVAARSRQSGFDAVPAVMAVATLGEVRDFPWPGAGDKASAANVAGAGAEGGVPESAVSERAFAEGLTARGEPAVVTAAPGADQLLATGLVAACLHIETGVRNFAEFAEAMAADLGDAVRPYLRAFYEAIRHYPGIDLTAMKPAAEDKGGLLFAA